MKFNIDAFKRFNKYINTDEKVNICKSCPQWVKLHALGTKGSTKKLRFACWFWCDRWAWCRSELPKSLPEHVCCVHSCFQMCFQMFVSASADLWRKRCPVMWWGSSEVRARKGRIFHVKSLGFGFSWSLWTLSQAPKNLLLELRRGQFFTEMALIFDTAKRPIFDVIWTF